MSYSRVGLLILSISVIPAKSLTFFRYQLLRELHKKDDPIVKWFDKGFPQTTLANGEVA